MRNVCVLLSGGYDSAFCLLRAIKRHGAQAVSCMFVNYGQPYYDHERAAVNTMLRAAPFGLDLVLTTWAPMMMKQGGTFQDRNLHLIDDAQTLGAQHVYIGTRCPLPMFDRHGDSNWWTLTKHARNRQLKISMPAMCMPKRYIKHAVRSGMPNAVVYSTEGKAS